MKVGDLVRLKNLHPEWGTMALIIGSNWSQIHLFANGTRRSVPVYRRFEYLEVLNENR